MGNKITKSKYYVKNDVVYLRNGDIPSQLINGNHTVEIIYGVVNSGNSKKENKKNSPYYSGEFANGLFHGRGRLISQDGGYYEGEFVDGVFHGKGERVVVGSDGIVVRYIGEFSNGHLNGDGKMITNGNIYTGYFIDDFLHGECKVSYVNGSVLICHMLDGRVDGYYVNYNKQGIVTSHGIEGYIHISYQLTNTRQSPKLIMSSVVKGVFRKYNMMDYDELFKTKNIFDNVMNLLLVCDTHNSICESSRSGSGYSCDFFDIFDTNALIKHHGFVGTSTSVKPRRNAIFIKCDDDNQSLLPNDYDESNNTADDDSLAILDTL